jgi:hypothetical protein
VVRGGNKRGYKASNWPLLVLLNIAYYGSMIIKAEHAQKVSDYPELVAAIERYKLPSKKKRGRPKKAETTMPSDLKIAMPSLLLNPNCDLGLFWDVFHEVEHYSESLPSRFNEWQQALNRIKHAAKQERDAAIKQANQQYENTLTQEVRPLESELNQMQHLTDAVLDRLPKEQLAEFFRKVAKRKSKGGHWRKKLQQQMPPQYQKFSFYGALSQWIKDKFGKDMKHDAIRKAIQSESELLRQGRSGVNV